MPIPLARLAAAAALAATLVLPGSVAAADSSPSAPPPAVVDWQTHLDHMRSMGGPLGLHVSECAAKHGSMAGMFGPDGSMMQVMDGGMMR
jgi:hypothetical protein